LAGLVVLVSLTPPRAEADAASEPGMPGPEIGLVRVDPKARNVYAYFLTPPRNLPERLHIAMTGLAHAGRIFETTYCCLVQEQHTGVGIHSGDSYEPEPATWRLQLIWPGPPPADIGWLGIVLPGREPVALAKGWVGIDLEDDGAPEVLFLCATVQDRDFWDKIEVYLGDPARALDEQAWHGSVDFALAPGLWDCGKWKS
jgi:hypothetical protein